MEQESYHERRPHSLLRPYVECYWASTTKARSKPREHRVLPDGCIDFIFDLSSESEPSGKTVGTMTKALLFRSSQPIHFVAIRFRPGGATPFLDIACHEITDGESPLPRRWQRLSLENRLHELTSTPAQFRLLEKTLLQQLEVVPSLDARVQRAITSVQQGQSNVACLSQDLGMSRQHLNRLFQQHVGVGPKTFGRVVRMQALLKQAKACNQPNWAAFAVDMGYSDQAHLVTECKALTGLTPTQLVAP